MRILTTFNDKIYNLSGKELLDSIEQNMPDAEVWIYEEVSEEIWNEISSRPLNVTRAFVNRIAEVDLVLTNNQDVISPEYGGHGEGMNMWNQRWFGWFKKVAMQYDAIVKKRHKGTNIFLDADIRIVKPITQDFIDSQLEKPVGLFKGNRDSVETGVVVVDGTSDFAKEFYVFVMSIYTNQHFRRLPRWDDSFVFAESMKRWGHIVQDFAEEVKAASYTNSNGCKTTEQVIPFTRWGLIFEHDKGTFLRDSFPSDLNVPK